MEKLLFERTRFKWDAVLKMTKAKLELIPDTDRDRISDIPIRYSKANNKYLKSYDSK